MQNKDFMTVGEIAKKMNTTVRTLQYYDKEGLLKPSSQSEGGRRLYTSKDIAKLHQILSMKFLGFSLDEIKNKLISLDTPEEVNRILDKQAQTVREKISNLGEALSAIEILQREIKEMKKVDFDKYAEIIGLLRMEKETNLLLKSFDDKTITHIKDSFTAESGKELLEKWKYLCEKIVKLKSIGVTPESESGQSIAKEWWDLVFKFIGDDMTLLPKLMKFNDNRENWNDEIRKKQDAVNEFIGEALGIFFMSQGMDIPNMEDGQNE